MTNPLSLLASLTGPEPARTPGPAEDPALFTAVLLAALQSGMTPKPQLAGLVAAVPLAESPADQQTSEDRGSGQGRGSANGASQEMPAAVTNPEIASPGSPAAVAGDDADDVGAMPVPPTIGSKGAGNAGIPLPSPADSAGIDLGPVPLRAEGNAGTEVKTTAAARSDSEPGLSAAVCAPPGGNVTHRASGQLIPAPSAQAGLSLLAGPVIVNPAVSIPIAQNPASPEKGSDAPHPAADDGEAACGVERASTRSGTQRGVRAAGQGEGRDPGGQRPEMDLIPVAMTGALPGATIPDTPGQSPADPAAPMDGQALLASAPGEPGQAGAGSRAPTPVASDPIDVGGGTGSQALAPSTVLTDARFAQAVAAIVGDGELTGIRIVLGRTVVRPVVRAGNVATATDPSIPGSDGQSAPPTAGRATVSLPRRTEVTTPNPGVERESIARRTARDTGVAPRATGSAPSWYLPDPLPLVEPARLGAMDPVPERNLPAPRQDLPGPPARVAREAEPAGSEGRAEAAGPSDGWAGISIGSPGSSEALTRGEPGTPGSGAGEARNLPGGKETRERPAGIADRITLQIADADGRATRIRVAVLGDQVRAVIQPHDGEAAMHLERRMDELQQALVRQGFVDPKVTVQPAATRAQAAPPWGSAPAAGPSDPPASRGTDQPPGDQRQGSGRREPGRDGDGHRHPQHHHRERDPQGRRR